MIRNPFTNHYIKINGPTYLKLKRELQVNYPELCNYYAKQLHMRGGNKSKVSEKLADFKKKMKARNQPDKTTNTPISEDIQPKLTKTEINRQMDRTGLAPAPEFHSYYHHHAPFSQVFGDYVCLKKDNLNDLATFLKTMFQEKTD